MALEFSVKQDPESRGAELLLNGTVDMADLEGFRSALAQLRATGRRDLVILFRSVELFSCFSLCVAVLIEFAASCVASSQTVSLRMPNDLAQGFRAAGLDAILPVLPLEEEPAKGSANS